MPGACAAEELNGRAGGEAKSADQVLYAVKGS